MISAGSECEISPCSGDVPAWFVWCPAGDTFIDAFCSQDDGKTDEEDGMLCFCILPDRAGQELAGEQKKHCSEKLPTTAPSCTAPGCLSIPNALPAAWKLRDMQGQLKAAWVSPTRAARGSSRHGRELRGQLQKTQSNSIQCHPLNATLN